MNIWLLSHGELLPIESGFHPMRTAMLAAELSRRGHDVTWWTSAFSHRRRCLIEHADASVQVSPKLQVRMLYAGDYRSTVSFARHTHNLRLARKFSASACKTKPPDVIVASYPVIELADEGIRFARRYNIPAIVDVRDYWPDLYLDRMPNWFNYPAKLALRGTFQKAERALNGANSLVGISDGILRFALRRARRQRGNADRVFPIGCRASMEGVTPPASLLHGGTHNPVFTCTFVGSFGSSYDLDTVLRAAARLCRTDQDAIRFILVGAGDKYDKVMRRAANLPNVRLTGWLKNAEAERVLALSDVALMPLVSRPDSLPNKFFEYLRAGVPIVSSLEGEVRDLLANRGLGYSFRAGDDSALATIIRKMSRERHHVRAMGRRCRDLFEERYISEYIYAAYAEHIEAFLGAPGPSERKNRLLTTFISSNQRDKVIPCVPEI